MGVSKQTMLDAFANFKVLQDEANEGKFVAKEDGKSLISDAELAKLAGIEAGAQKNPDLSGYATTAKVQLAFAAALSVMGGEYTPPENPGDNTGGDDTSDDPNPNPNPNPNPDDDDDDEDEGDEDITEQDIKDIFGKN